jgi:hypothetical protein
VLYIGKYPTPRGGYQLMSFWGKHIKLKRENVEKEERGKKRRKWEIKGENGI